MLWMWLKTLLLTALSFLLSNVVMSLSLKGKQWFYFWTNFFSSLSFFFLFWLKENKNPTAIGIRIFHNWILKLPKKRLNSFLKGRWVTAKELTQWPEGKVSVLSQFQNFLTYKSISQRPISTCKTSTSDFTSDVPKGWRGGVLVAFLLLWQNTMNKSNLGRQGFMSSYNCLIYP
jgi:hypothetical protein